MTFIDRTKAEYALLSPTPSDYDLFLDSIFTMWASQPDWNSHFFKRIDGKRVWIVDGDLEEAVKRYQQEDMAKWIFGSGLLILPQTSHFAFIQDPGMFNDALLRFLELEFE
jgi:pimeloyl-ACP methyl ester carboxylesterase